MSLQESNIGIEKTVIDLIIKELNHLLADEYVLLVKTRAFHWDVRGMQFYMLHELFDSQYQTIAEQIDQIAERIRMLGGWPLGAMNTMTQQTRLSENNDPVRTPDVMLLKLLKDNETICQLTRPVIEKTNNLGDFGTADLLTGTIRTHEKFAWFLRSHLPVNLE
jgi:starvation-inducible DNA-binding protein